MIQAWGRGRWRRAVAMLMGAAGLGAAAPAMGETVLFIGNSFTFGALSPVWKYRAETVTDLNGEGIGGVPALVKLFADEAGKPLEVSLETSPGKGLDWHWTNKRAIVDRPWDHVVLQDYSTLDAAKPGDASELVQSSGRFASLFTRRNPKADISLTATWSRPDQTFIAGGAWYGRSIYQMARDVRAGYDRAARRDRRIARVNPVGDAFNCAIAAGIADANPYDGIAYGQVGLWAHDHYHASAHGYYLEALTVFAGLTGIDPRTLTRDERAAAELGIAADTAAKLQAIAWQVTQGGGCQAAGTAPARP